MEQIACTERVNRRRVAADRSHAASERALFVAADVASPHVFHSSAWRAVMRSMRGLAVPTRIGSGDCTGLGSAAASVIVYTAPSKVVRGSVSSERTIWIASSKR